MFFPYITFLYFPVYIAAYFVLLFLFPYFFRQPLPRVARRSVQSLAYVVIVTSFFFIVSAVVPDEDFGNRILHSLGGGFVAMLICFYAARDSKVRISKFQFFVLSFLLVTALGVGNEIAEFFGQNYAGLVFAPNINDTWLDLISNTVGLLLCEAFVVPLFPARGWSVSGGNAKD